ncbi:MAG: acylphosphatase [Campylobacteraceae bacterium 4484_4]|nr:MAG: acylphosphatase [Campylobacteraceae bacterium 4484_4]
MKVYRFIVKGKVQGVFYRKSIQQMASLGHIQGYVKNLPDGSVEVVAALHEDQLEDFLQMLKNGSPASRVDEIEMEELEEDDLLYDGFEIRY